MGSEQIVHCDKSVTSKWPAVFLVIPTRQIAYFLAMK